MTAGSEGGVTRLRVIAGRAAASYRPRPRRSEPRRWWRRCLVCGASLDGRRSDARYCSGGCRTEAWRVRRLLGRPLAAYGTLADRMTAYRGCGPPYPSPGAPDRGYDGR